MVSLITELSSFSWLNWTLPLLPFKCFCIVHVNILIILILWILLTTILTYLIKFLTIQPNEFQVLKKFNMCSIFIVLQFCLHCCSNIILHILQIHLIWNNRIIDWIPFVGVDKGISYRITDDIINNFQ